MSTFDEMVAREKRHPSLTRDYILSRLHVIPDTGKCYWIDPGKYHQNLVGKEAGHIKQHGNKNYWVVKVNGLAYLRGHLIYAVAYNRWPLPYLDHKDGDSTNDKFSNLRIATSLQNAQNRKIGDPGKTLPMGVREMNGRYQARIVVNKKTLYLGCFSLPEQAASAYAKAREHHFGAWA